MEKMTLKPVTEWHKGWSKESKESCLKMMGIPRTVKEAIKMQFKGWTETRFSRAGGAKLNYVQPSPFGMGA